MNSCKIQTNNIKKNESHNCCSNSNSNLYLMFHIILSFVAVYLSWKCNNQKFELYSFISASLFPYFYIMYILATQGTCNIFNNEINIK